MTIQKEIDKWFRIAQSDLNVAVRCLAEADNGIWVYAEPKAACFHCQQAIEKALKGYLVYCGIEPPKTHDLETLCQLCITQDTSFSVYLDICDKTTKYATAGRYGEDDEDLIIDNAAAKQTLADAETVFNFCKEKMICRCLS
jgi:HEPN domain-containing protein